MSEHKIDELTATGSHRAWVGEAGNSVVRAGSPGRDVQRSWLTQAQPANPRHAAITRSLNSWSNYKSWTDRVKHGWDKEKK